MGHLDVKPVRFHPKAVEIVRKFPKAARDLIGRGLYRLQLGEVLALPHSRPMPSVAKGVHELRVKDADNAYRVFYYLATTDGLLVFHAFVKKSQETPLSEIRLAAQRLKEMTDA